MSKTRKVRGFGKGRSPTKFYYRYEDIAALAGTSVAAARKHAQRGNFDPNSLPSILEFVKDRLAKDRRLEDKKAQDLIEHIEVINKNLTTK